MTKARVPILVKLLIKNDDIALVHVLALLESTSGS